MSETPRLPSSSEIEVITVRYWASARAAAGTDHDEVAVTAPTSLAEVTARAVALHAGTPAADRLPRVLDVCSVLVGDQPVGTRPHADVVVRPGDSVEFLPPFAGG